MKSFIACALIAAVSVAFTGCKKAEDKKAGDKAPTEQKAPDKAPEKK